MAKYGKPDTDRPKAFYPRIDVITVYALRAERITGKNRCFRQCPSSGRRRIEQRRRTHVRRNQGRDRASVRRQRQRLANLPRCRSLLRRPSYILSLTVPSVSLIFFCTLDEVSSDLL